MATRSKLAVILHADVVGSTALVQADERLAHERIRKAFEQLSETIARYGGTAHEVRGDALLAEFNRASDAVTASLAFQVENRSRNESLSGEVRPEVRVGIALGEVIIADQTITGAGVVLAQRLEQLAEPGGVCIQGAAYETVPKRLPFEYQTQGEQTLKGFEEPVRAYTVSLKVGEVIPAAEAVDRPARAKLELPEKPSIAVLPFTNISGDSGQEYFSDGITEDIITDLSKLSGLLVIARNSTFTYKGQATKVQKIGAELGARYIVEGSIQKAAARVRVSAQLIDAQTGFHLWAERYDRELSDIFTLQDDLTKQIVLALKVRLAPEETGRFGRRDTKDIEVYDLLLRARECAFQITKESNGESRRIYNKVLQIDPASASAYAGLARSHLADWVLGWNRSPEESLDRAMNLAERAMELDDDLAYPHAVLGKVYLWKRKHEHAVREGERAIVLEPNDADNTCSLAMTLAWAGNPEQATSLVERAIRLDPKCPANFYFTLGHTHFLMRRYEQATDALERAKVCNPDYRGTYVYLAASYACLGQRDRAMTERDTFLKINPEGTIAALSEKLPYRRESDLQRLVDSLREAGWPE